MKRLYPKSIPRAISFFPSLSDPYESHFYDHMFTQDIHMGIMPIGGRSERRKEYNVTFLGIDKNIDLATNLCLSLSGHEFRYNSPKEIVADAVGNLASDLSWRGISYYEIINNLDDPACPFLHRFTHKNLFSLPGWYLQVIPKKDYPSIKKHLGWIKKTFVWSIKMPSALGGYHGYRKILATLIKTNPLTPKFALNKMELIQSTPGFDFKGYNANIEIMINKLTHKWGWNRRDSSDDKCTEFYSIYKHLSLDLSKAILREHIVSELNNLLKRLEVKCTILIHGLPTSKDILKIRQGLIDGSTDFNKVFDMVAI